MHVYRSQDGGASWSIWGTLMEPGGGSGNYGYSCTTLDVVEGIFDRVYLACSYTPVSLATYEVQVISADIHSPSATWNAVTVHSTTELQYTKSPLDLITDVDDYSSYYVYVLLQDRSDGFSLWFTRSTDQGATFSNIYVIAQAPDSDHRFWFGDLDYGFGGYIHCVYGETEYIGDNSRVVHRRASSFADQGAASWEMPTAVSAWAPNGAAPFYPTIAASRSDATVIAGYSVEGGNSATRLSLDQGASWPAGGIKIHAEGTIKVARTPTGFVATSYLADAQIGMETCALATPLSWEPLQLISDLPEPSSYGAVHAASDPTRGDRLAFLWTRHDGFGAYHCKFDAEWQSDPGWPNVLPPFPVSLPWTPISSPALVDLDDDPQLEIVFTSASSWLSAYDHDGTTEQGWQAWIGSAFVGGMAAAADLDQDGVPEIAVGNADGQVYLFRADGTAVPGWPVDLGLGNGNVHVSIGTVSRLSQYDVVACQGVWTFVLGFDGRIRKSYNAMSGTAAVAPAALADLNGDLHDEIIVGLQTRVVIIDYVEDRVVRARSFGGKTVNGQPTVGDLDLDGDFEVVAPTAEGDVFVFDGITMVDHPGWPFTDVAAGPITSVALANMFGNMPLELAFAGENQIVHVLPQTGADILGWPVSTGAGWFVRAMPIVEVIHGVAPDLIVGARDSKAYAWTNGAVPIGGWPEELSDKVNFAPASGDIDADSEVELLFLTDTTIEVVEVQSSATVIYDNFRWPMEGHDPQRSGCQGCEPDLVTAVDDPSAPSTVLFRAPAPNPTPAGVRFAYELPRAARVQLAVFDARGRRVRTLIDGVQEPGVHELHWRGDDEHKRRVARGQYYARLEVEGDRAHTRKLTILR